MPQFKRSMISLSLIAAGFLSMPVFAEEAVVAAKQDSIQLADAVLRINLTTGARSVISSMKQSDKIHFLSDQYPQELTGLGIEPSGQIIVAAVINDSVLAESVSAPADAVYRVNPVTGDRKLLSNFGDASQGILGYGLIDLIVDTSGHIIVDTSGYVYLSSESNGYKIFFVDPSTGHRTVVSDSNVSSQGKGWGAFAFGDLSVLPSGTLLLSGNNKASFLKPDGSNYSFGECLFTVDPATGIRTSFTSFSDSSEGGVAASSDAAFGPPTGGRIDSINLVAVDTSGRILTAFPGGTDNHGALYYVDANTGMRTLISDFGNSQQGQVIDEPVSLKVTVSGRILVLDNGYPNTAGALFAIDPSTGNRTVISDFSNPSQGSGFNPTAMAVGTIPTGGVVLPTTTDTISNPDIGLGGKVTIVGAGFATKKGGVKIGGKAAGILSWSDAQVVVNLPALKAGAYAVNITPYKKAAINVGQLNLHAPTLNSLSTNSGAKNTKLSFTVNGQYFGIGVKPTVYLVSSKNKRTALTVAKGYTDTLLTVSTAKLKADNYQVLITNSVGSSQTLAFTVQ